MAKRKTSRGIASARSTITRKSVARTAKSPARPKAAPAASASRGQGTAKRPKPSARKTAKKTGRTMAKAVAKKSVTTGVKKGVKKAVGKAVRRAVSGKAGTKAVVKASTKAGIKPVAKSGKPAVKQPTRAATTRVVAASAASKRPDRGRRRQTLEETVQTPPSSLDMDNHATAARSGRAALQSSLKEHNDMTPELTAGDVDANWENAYFSGDESPGGDNPSPDENVVDDIGKALGVEYQDNEELQGSEKVIERDEHRWELDPASAEDYKDRK